MVNRNHKKGNETFITPYTERSFGEYTVNTHATQVAEELEADRQPILPFELRMLEDKHEAHKIEQRDLGTSMTDAMSETSETWHDNGAADAINAASRALGYRASVVIRGIRNGVEIPYPNAEDKQATMGSVIGVQFEGDDTSYPHFITGMLREVPESIRSHIPDDSEIVTAGSPFGRAVLGCKAGEARTFSIRNGHKVTLNITSVSQIRE
ncbi:MAG: hypothetical protein ABIQ64_02340 [Candidatus Saccharimonadales bacterium]